MRTGAAAAAGRRAELEAVRPRPLAMTRLRSY